jgi:hypothetical protein
MFLKKFADLFPPLLVSLLLSVSINRPPGPNGTHQWNPPKENPAAGSSGVFGRLRSLQRLAL